MKNLMFILLVFLSFTCRRMEKPEESAADAEFDKLCDEYLTGYLNWRPGNAVYLGFHEYDGKLWDGTKASISGELARLKQFDEKLSEIDTALLSSEKNHDFRILRFHIKNEIFGFEDLKYYSKDPITYSMAAGVHIYIKRNFAPIEDRLKSIIAIENNISNIFRDAKLNLDDTLPVTHIRIAIAMARGSAFFLGNDLIMALQDVKNDSLMNEFQIANKKAIDAYNDYALYLEKEKLPRADNKYAIGKENYSKMLLYSEGLTLSPDSILAIGMKALSEEQEVFRAAAKVISPEKDPMDVYNELQNDHPEAANLITDAAKNIEGIRQFLVDHDIITIPSEVRVIVEETPAYSRATSSASMDVPGPFETKSTETYYYITPVDLKWTEKQKEDWLRQFNYYTIDMTSIHEAYPGHYTQFLHLNASNVSKIRKIFGSYAFIEGWAHYAEKMIIDAGYGNNGDSIRAAKIRLAQSGDALLRICRLCVSINMHCNSMTVEQATQFFMDNCYQGEKPSQQEALRGAYDPGYLFYTLGKLQLLKLQEDYKKQEGPNYNLKKFNDALVDQGMPPIQILREILLKDKSQWHDIL